MRLVSLAEIQSAVSFGNAIEAVRSGFIASAEGKVTLPDPMQLLFHSGSDELLGDCHVKTAQSNDLPYFVIKVATGFYSNPTVGLPVNNGMLLVMSAETGQPLALLQDDGWLTQVRTAAAGALAAGVKPIVGHETLGIVGTGTQAMLQAKAISQHLKLKRVFIYGRSSKKAQVLVDQLNEEGLEASRAVSVKELCHASSIVVTTTPATEPVISLSDMPRQLHIIAVGADSPGKVELDPAILAKADVIMTDSHTQCLAHGDFGAAVRAGEIEANSDMSFTGLLAGLEDTDKVTQCNLSVVDLTGLGVQDLAMATMVMESLGEPQLGA